MKLKIHQRLVLSSSGKGGLVEKNKARTEGRYFAGITLADYVCMCVMNLAKKISTILQFEFTHDGGRRAT